MVLALFAVAVVMAAGIGVLAARQRDWSARVAGWTAFVATGVVAAGFLLGVRDPFADLLIAVLAVFGLLYGSLLAVTISLSAQAKTQASV